MYYILKDPDTGFTVATRSLEWCSSVSEYLEMELSDIPDDLELYDIEDGALVLNAAKQSDVLAVKAKEARVAALDAPLFFDGVAYDYDAAGKKAIFETISEAAVLLVPDSTTAAWRLADNTERITSLAELKAIVVLGARRKEVIWQQFNAWHKGPKAAPFEVVFDPPVEEVS